MGENEVCNLVVFGQQSPDIALVVNGLTGIQLLTPEETNQQICITRKHTAQAPGVIEGPNEQTVSVKAYIFAGLGSDIRQAPESIWQSCPREKLGVLIYCITVSGLEIETTEMIDEMNKITKAYTEDVWKNCVIVFLKAHRCARALQASNQHETAVTQSSFKKVFEVWKEQVQSTMFSKSMITPIPSKFIKNMSFAVAGKENELALFGRDFWLSVLWVEVYETSTKAWYKKGIAKLAKFQTRTKERSEMRKPEVSDEIARKKIWEQPISTGNMSLSQKIAIGAGGTAAGVAAGGIGATIGGLIGALAFGIPSFGVAAGAGLVIGAAVGGGIGVGVAGATTAGVNAYQKLKEEEEQKQCKLLQVCRCT